jgi:hypothetical protein
VTSRRRWRGRQKRHASLLPHCYVYKPYIRWKRRWTRCTRRTLLPERQLQEVAAQQAVCTSASRHSASHLVAVGALRLHCWHFLSCSFPHLYQFVWVIQFQCSVHHVGAACCKVCFQQVTLCVPVTACWSTGGLRCGVSGCTGRLKHL